jgi:hypothetical protein
MTSLSNEIEGLIKKKKRQSRHSRRNELARKWLGVAIVVGSIIGYLISR